MLRWRLRMSLASGVRWPVGLPKLMTPQFLRERFLSYSTATLLCLGVMLAGGAARAETIHLEIDPQRSQIVASVAEPLSRMRDNAAAEGKFQVLSGAVDGDPARPAETGHVKLLIDPTTYDSGSRRRDNNVLRDSLETARYGSITFESTRVEDVDVQAAGVIGKATIVGNLTLHGTTREIKAPVTVSLDPEGLLTSDGEVTFNYTDFGVKAPRLLFALPASDQVTVKFRVVARKPGSAAQSRATITHTIAAVAVGMARPIVVR